MRAGANTYSQTAQHVALTTSLLVIVGLVAFVLVGLLQLETKWVVYCSAAALIALTFVVVRNKEALLWGALIISFQFDVYLRLPGGVAFGFPAVMAAAVTVWYLIQYRTIRLKTLEWGGSLAIPILLLFMVFFVSAALADNQMAAVRIVVAHLQFLFIFLVARNAISSEERLDFTVRMLMVVLVIQSIVYFIQSALGITFTLTGEVIDATGRSSTLPRPGGTVSTNPAGFASFIMPLVCLAGASYVVARNRGSEQLKVLVPLLLGLGAIALTITRAAWISVFLGLALVGWLSVRRGLLSRNKLFAIAGVAGVVALIAIPLMAARLEDSSTGSALGERTQLMRVAWEIIKGNPIFGVGPGSYRFSISDYLTVELYNVWRVEVHNHYLLRLAETGLVGGTVFVLILVTALRQALQVARFKEARYRAIGMGLAGAIVAVSFEMFWDIWGGFTYNALLWFSFGVIGAARQLASRKASAATAGASP